MEVEYSNNLSLLMNNFPVQLQVHEGLIPSPPSEYQNSKSQQSKEYVAKSTVKKRRESVRACEEKRRKKHQQQLDTLKNLLFSGQEGSRVTREEILEKAIQAAIEYNNITKAKEAQKQVDPLESFRFSFHQDELEHSFRFILTKQFSLGLDFNAYRTVDDVFHSLNMLKNIATELNKIEYLLQVSVFDLSVKKFVRPGVKEAEVLSEQAMALYEEAKAQGKSTIFEMTGVDILFRITVDKAFSCFMRGNFKGALQQWYKAIAILPTPLIHQSAVLGPFTMFRMMLGSFLTLEEAMTYIEKTSLCDVKSLFMEPVIGLALIKEGQKEQGIQMIKRSIQSLSQRIGSSCDLIFSFCLVNGYQEAGYLDEGIAFSDYLINKHKELKIECLPGMSEVYRIKACMMLEKLKEIDFLLDPKDLTSKVSEIQHEIQLGFQHLMGRECHFLEMKLAVLLGKVLLRYGHRLQKEQVLKTLSELYGMMTIDEYLCAKSTVLEEARSVLAELNLKLNNLCTFEEERLSDINAF